MSGGNRVSPLPPAAAAGVVATLWLVGFLPNRVEDAGHPVGAIDYRLARQSAIRRFRRGSVDRQDICDAQRELVRVATGCAEPTDEDCPICGEDRLRHVRFAFGPRLPSGGRCVTAAELARLGRRSGSFTCYVVEVCVTCRWNHLVRSFPLGGGLSGA